MKMIAILLAAVAATNAHAQLVIKNQTLKKNLSIEHKSYVTISFPNLQLAEGFLSIDDNSALAAVYIPLLSEADSYLMFSRNPALTDLNLPELESAQSIYITDNAAMASVNLPSLIQAGALVIEHNASIVNIDAQQLATCPALMTEHNVSLQSVNLPNLVNGGAGLSFFGCTSLMHLDCSSFNAPDGINFSFYGCSLDTQSVNLLLSRAVANPSCVSGTINLSAGNNSPPTGQGLNDKATLQARGVFVQTN